MFTSHGMKLLFDPTALKPAGTIVDAAPGESAPGESAGPPESNAGMGLDHLIQSLHEVADQKMKKTVSSVATRALKGIARLPISEGDGTTAPSLAGHVKKVVSGVAKELEKGHPLKARIKSLMHPSGYLPGATTTDDVMSHVVDPGDSFEKLLGGVYSLAFQKHLGTSLASPESLSSIFTKTGTIRNSVLTGGSSKLHEGHLEGHIRTLLHNGYMSDDDASKLSEYLHVTAGINRKQASDKGIMAKLLSAGVLETHQAGTLGRKIQAWTADNAETHEWDPEVFGIYLSALQMAKNRLGGQDRYSTVSGINRESVGTLHRKVINDVSTALQQLAGTDGRNFYKTMRRLAEGAYKNNEGPLVQAALVKILHDHLGEDDIKFGHSGAYFLTKMAGKDGAKSYMSLEDALGAISLCAPDIIHNRDKGVRMLAAALGGHKILKEDQASELYDALHEATSYMFGGDKLRINPSRLTPRVDFYTREAVRTAADEQGEAEDEDEYRRLLEKLGVPLHPRHRISFERRDHRIQYLHPPGGAMPDIHAIGQDREIAGRPVVADRSFDDLFEGHLEKMRAAYNANAKKKVTKEEYEDLRQGSPLGDEEIGILNELADSLTGNLYSGWQERQPIMEGDPPQEVVAGSRQGVPIDTEFNREERKKYEKLEEARRTLRPGAESPPVAANKSKSVKKSFDVMPMVDRVTNLSVARFLSERILDGFAKALALSENNYERELVAIETVRSLNAIGQRTAVSTISDDYAPVTQVEILGSDDLQERLQELGLHQFLRSNGYDEKVQMSQVKRAYALHEEANKDHSIYIEEIKKALSAVRNPFNARIFPSTIRYQINKKLGRS